MNESPEQLADAVDRTVPAPPTTRRAALAAERAARESDTASRRERAPRPARPRPARPRPAWRRVAAPSRASRPSRGARPAPRARPLRERLVFATAAAAAAVLFGAAAVPLGASAQADPTLAAVSSPVVGAQRFTANATVDPASARDGFTVSRDVVRALAGGDTAIDVTQTGGDVRFPFAAGAPTSSGFGSRNAPCSGCSSQHQGIDFTPGAGTPIGAVAAGVVSKSGYEGAFGQMVQIEHEIDGRAVTSLYAHMQVGSSPLAVGQSVAVGQFVGRVGSSGASTGAHLHLEIHLDGTPIDPLVWLRANAGRTL